MWMDYLHFFVDFACFKLTVDNINIRQHQIVIFIIHIHTIYIGFNSFDILY